MTANRDVTGKTENVNTQDDVTSVDGPNVKTADLLAKGPQSGHDTLPKKKKPINNPGY